MVVVLRVEVGGYLFHNLDEVRDHATKWLWVYNNECPHTAIGGIPPRQKVPPTA